MTDPELVAGPPVGQLAALVSLGGVVGALARYGLATAWPVTPERFPWSTLVINLSGSLLLGLLVGRHEARARLRALLGTGVLGGWTTMSTFAVEVDHLLAAHCWGRVAAYLVASVAGGVGLAALGVRLGSRSGGRSEGRSGGRAWGRAGGRSGGRPGGPPGGRSDGRPGAAR